MTKYGVVWSKKNSQKLKGIQDIFVLKILLWIQWHKTTWSETARMRSFFSLLGHAWLEASLFCFSLTLAIGAQFEKGRLKR